MKLLLMKWKGKKQFITTLLQLTTLFCMGKKKYTLIRHTTRVTCHVSHVTSHIFFFFFRTKWWTLSVEGLLSTGPTPSSLYCVCLLHETLILGLHRIYCVLGVVFVKQNNAWFKKKLVKGLALRCFCTPLSVIKWFTIIIRFVHLWMLYMPLIGHFIWWKDNYLSICWGMTTIYLHNITCI